MSFLNTHFPQNTHAPRLQRTFKATTGAGAGSLASSHGATAAPAVATASAANAHADLRLQAEQTLGSNRALAQAVVLPPNEDPSEWLALHVVDFYNQLNMLYGTITEFCSPQTCPRMTATSEYEYLWQDPLQRSKPPAHMSAPGYIEALMQWIQGFLDDETVFPVKMGVPFPLQFHALVKTIFKRMFRVYAHIYCHHFDEVNELGVQMHLNTSLKHFVLFAREFDLLTKKDLGPLQELVERF